MGKEHEEAFEKGKQDAKKAGALDEAAHSLSSAFSTTKKDKSYDAGWKEGIKQK